MSRSTVAATITALALCAASLAPRPAEAALCFHDANFDGTGVPIKWLASPIAYRINVSKLPANEQAAATAAVKAAFDTWNALTCTTLSFQYAGGSSTFGSVAGVINVYFGDDAASWTHGTSPYWWYYGGITSLTTGEMTKGSIGMNAKDWSWSTGTLGAKTYDIQSVVTQLIPGTIGFFVGNDVAQGNIDFQPNQVARALTAEHAAGARATYPKSGAGCGTPITLTPCATYDPAVDAGPVPDIGVQDAGVPKDSAPKPDSAPADAGPPADALPPVPDAPPISDGTGPSFDSGATPTGDGGATPTGDATPTADGGATPTADGGVTPTGDGGATPIGDGGATPAGDGGAADGGGDDGGCSTSHALGADQSALLLLGLLALLARRRRRS